MTHGSNATFTNETRTLEVSPRRAGMVMVRDLHEVDGPWRQLTLEEFRVLVTGVTVGSADDAAKSAQ